MKIGYLFEDDEPSDFELNTPYYYIKHSDEVFLKYGVNPCEEIKLWRKIKLDNIGDVEITDKIQFFHNNGKITVKFVNNKDAVINNFKLFEQKLKSEPLKFYSNTDNTYFYVKHQDTNKNDSVLCYFKFIDNIIFNNT